MKAKTKTWGGARPGAGRKPKARSFEADDPTTRNRPRLVLASLEGKKELNPSSRVALMKMARWARNNHGFAARIVRGIPRYAVGTGMSPQARTGDGEWNNLAEELFEDAVGSDAFAFDKSGSVNFYGAQSMILEQIITDGDFFAQLVRSETGRGMMKFVSAEYVGNPLGERDEAWLDGVRVNKDGRPIAYRVTKAPGSRDYKDVSADDLIHFRKLHAWGYVRGVSWLCNSLQRFQEWRAMLDDEQASARLNTKIAMTIQTPDEELSLGRGVTETKNDDGSNVVRLETLNDGVSAVRLQPGEKLAPHDFSRPSQNFEPWINFLAREISWGVGLSPEILWAIAGIGGANTRYVLQDAETFFAQLRHMIEHQFCRRFWRYWVWGEIRAGRLPFPGNDWWRVEFTPPQRLTVDFGRDSKIYLEMINRGMLSPQRWFNMLGQNWESEMEDVLRAKARHIKLIEQVSKEEGVDLSEPEEKPEGKAESNAE
jgi:lambda family phage portal protein